MTEQRTLTDLINNEFLYENVKMVMPMKKTTYRSLGETRETMIGGKSNFTKDQLVEFWTTGVVVKGKDKNTDYKRFVSDSETELYEIRLRHTDRLVMIDVDGSFGNKNDITTKQFFETEGLPAWFKSCPYTLSRSKKLPHLILRLTNTDRDKLENIYTDCFKLFNGDLLVNHAWEKPDAVVYNYNDVIPEISWDELQELFNPESKEGGKLLNVFLKKAPKEKKPKVEKVESNDNTNVDYNRFEAYIDAGLLNDYCCEGSNKDYVKLCYAFIHVLGEEKAETLLRKLVFEYGSTNKQNSFETDFAYYSKPTDKEQRVGRTTIINFAKKVDAEKVKEINKQFKTKKEQNFNIPDGAKIASDDNGCADIIIEMLGDKLMYTNKRVFFKKDNIWICDKDDIVSFLVVYCMNANVVVITMHEPRNYCGGLSAATSVVNTILHKIKANPVDIYHKFHSTTKGRIAFLNGVLDFKAEEFYTWDEIDFEYYTTQQINRDFNPAPSQDKKEEIKSKIFKPLFGKNCDSFLRLLARALAGHFEDKNWISYFGNRNSGKGVLYDLLKYTFGSYVGTFGVENVLCLRQTNNVATARDMYWLMDLEFVRFALTQETPKEDMKINSKIIKSICSGGDTLTARRNFDRHDTQFILETCIAIFGNNHLECNENDCNERRWEFSSVIQFKTQEEIDELKKDKKLTEEVINERYLIKDDKIKDKVKTEEYADALLLLIVESYGEALSKTKKTDVDDDENQPLIVRLLDNLEITKKDTDVILGDHLRQMFGETAKKIANELASYGVKYKKNKSRSETRDKLCFFGVKFKEDEEIKGDI